MPPTDAHATARLETLLTELLRAHEDLRDNLLAQRQAVSSAAPERLAACTARQREIGATIAALEQRRRELVVQMMRAMPGLPRTAAGQPTLQAICAGLPEPERTRTGELARRLRELLTIVGREASSLRLATATLVAHMDGLMEQVGRRLSHAGTYSRPGAPRTTDAVVSGIDLTS